MALFSTFLLSNIDSSLLFNYRFPTLPILRPKTPIEKFWLRHWHWCRRWSLINNRSRNGVGYGVAFFLNLEWIGVELLKK